MEKHLKVNTAMMDMISTKPETIDAYDEISINCAMCLTTAKTRQLLSKGRIKVNTSAVVDCGNDDDVEVVTINGGKKTTAQFAAPQKPTILIVNGGLIIEDSPKKNIDQYRNVIVNGGVLHPMSFDTSNIHTNGAMIPYPDGATLILRHLDLDNSFIKAAVPGTVYYVQGVPSDMGAIGDGNMDELKKTALHATEPLDLELLKSKNIRFYTTWVTAIEENAEQLLKIIDGCIGSTIIPAGYKIMQGGKLDMLAVRRFGKRIYVEGDLEVQAENSDALAALEGLIVTGNTRIADSVADEFFKKCTKYNGLTVFKGEWINVSDTDYTINTELLNSLENGGTFNIADSTVQIEPDVAPEMLLNKVYEIFLNDSTLTVSLNQQNALRKRIHNNDSSVNIREYERAKEPEPEPAPETDSEPEEQDILVTKINCAYYKL